MPGYDADLPDYVGASAYALDRLTHELPPTLFYHSVWHTRDEVVPRVEWLARREGLSREALCLVRTAAYYHDLGLISDRDRHEEASIEIARNVLPGLGYTHDQIRIIAGIIIATRLPQTPRTLLEEIVADADLDVLGRDDFLTRNRALRAELVSSGAAITDEAWYIGQLRFLRQHRYFTATAREERARQKQENLRAMRDIAARLTETNLADFAAREAPGSMRLPLPGHLFPLR